MAAPELQVTPQGQVLNMEGEQSILDLYSQYERKLAAARPKLTTQLVRKVTGIRPLSQLPQPKVETLAGDGLPMKVLLRPEPGIVLPALYWPKGDATPVLIAPDEGMNGAAAQAQRIHDKGQAVLVVEVRDTGETKTRNWRFHGADNYIAYMLGRSYLAMRAEDLLICARWIAQQEDAPSVRLVGYGEIGPAALHAATLEPKQIELGSYRRFYQLVARTDDQYRRTPAHPQRGTRRPAVL